MRGGSSQLAAEIEREHGADVLDILMGPKPEKQEKPAATKRRKRNGGQKFRIAGDELQYEAEEGEWLRLCRKLEIVAGTRTVDGDGWGRLMRLFDDDGREHLWSMPIRLADGDSVELMSQFSDRGLDTPMGRKREKLIEYLKNYPVSERVICCESVGWHRESYVLPHKCFTPEGAEMVYFQCAGRPDSRYAQAGTLEEWREKIGRHCRGNSRLILAVSSAFAGPLLKLLNMEGGGIHFTGTTSSGKSTALMVAGSVCGGGEGRGFGHQWRATGNGLEGLAQGHSDGLLILDEVAQLDARETAEAVYLLANGAGKARMQRSGGLRKSAQWRVMFLSAGELKLADHAETAGRRMRGGAEVRCLDIPADAGTGKGMFEEIHGHQSPAALADALKAASTKVYGVALVAYLERLVRDGAALADSLQNQHRRFIADQLSTMPDAPGEIRRALSRFGLLAVAGELATRYGITGWEPGEADRAAETCFFAWLRGRGGAVKSDEVAALSQVRRFIEQHAASRFQSAEVRYTSDGEPLPEKVPNQAGYVRTVEDGRQEYLFTPEVFRTEVCRGHNHEMVLKLLEAHGHLRRIPGHWTVSTRIRGRVMRVYQVLDSILTAETTATTSGVNGDSGDTQ